LNFTAEEYKRDEKHHSITHNSDIWDMGGKKLHKQIPTSTTPELNSLKSELREGGIEK
jgi:hypothetical protein